MLLTSPNTGTAAANTNSDLYAAMSLALLAVLPTEGQGLTWAEIEEALAPMLPTGLFTKTKTMRWYAICVRLDLEGKGLVERIAEGRPLRFRRAA